MKKNRIGRRIVTMLLTLAMLCGMLPEGLTIRSYAAEPDVVVGEEADGDEPMADGAEAGEGGEGASAGNEAGADVEKTITGLCTGTIENPAYGAGGWCYVYLGNKVKDDGTKIPLKFRVLDKAATEFHANKTMLLDCERAVTSMSFGKNFQDNGNVWAESPIREWLNGKDFYRNPECFTSSEGASIVKSIKSAPAEGDGRGMFRYPTGATPTIYSVFTPLEEGRDSLNRPMYDRFFLLDAMEATNPSYGFTDDGGNNPDSVRSKDASYLNSWWLRSPYYKTIKDHDSDREIHYGFKVVGGGIYELPVGYSGGVSPACNVDLGNVVFTSLIPNTSNDYKLTLGNGWIEIAKTDGQEVTRKGNVVTVPYTISDYEAETATRVSVLLTDNEFKLRNRTAVTSGFTYLKLNVPTWGLSGTGTFTLPDEYADKTCGVDYYAYILAEDVNEGVATDYASTPRAITIPDRGPEQVSTPAFSPEEIAYTEAKDVTISCETEGATIYYTTDGSTPTTGSREYNGPIRVSVTTTIKAIAVKDEMADSEVAAATYTIRGDLHVTPPTAKSNLVYNGRLQELIDTGVLAGATLYYAVTKGGAAEPDSSRYSGTIPSESAAGSYDVWYMVAGDEDHPAVKAGKITVSIAKKDISEATVTLGETLTYNGSEQTKTVDQVMLGSSNIPASEYMLTGNKATDAGSYTLTITAKPDGNYTGSVEKTYIIGKKDISPVVTVNGTYSYTGQALVPDVTVKESAAAGAAELAESDYSVSLSDNIRVGNGKITVSAAADGNYSFDAVTAEFAIGKGNAAAPVGITTVSETLKGKADGEIRGLSAKMEYSMDGGSTWNGCPGTVLRNAKAGDYLIRYKANEDQFASEAISVTVAAGAGAEIKFEVEGKDDAGTITVKAKDEQGEEYTLANGKISQEGTEQKYTMADLSYGFYNIEVVHSGTKEGVDFQKTSTVLAETTADSVELRILVLQPGQNESKVDANVAGLAGAGVNGVLIGGLENEAENLKDASEQAARDNVITMEITSGGTEVISDTDAEKDEKQDIINKASVAYGNEETKAAFLEINVKQTDANGQVVKNLDHLNTVLELLIPYNFNGKYDVRLWRSHAGEETAQLIPLSSRPVGNFTDGSYYIDRAHDRIFVYGSKYCVYALTYTTAEYCEVSFNTDSGSAVDKQNVKKGEKITKPADPVKDGYNFAGWYNGDREWDFENDTVTSDLELTARWTEKITPPAPPAPPAPAEPTYYSVSFNMSGKEATDVPELQKVEKGKTALRPEKDPKAEGFVFAGWYTEESCENVYDFSTPVTADITLYAGWEAIPEPDPIVIEEAANWNLYEDASVHEYKVRGISVDGTVENSNEKSKAYYEAKLSGTVITVRVIGDRKEAAKPENAALKFDLGENGVIEFNLPVSYEKPVLKLSSNAAVIKKGKETVLRTTVLVKNADGSFEPYDMTDVTVSGNGLGTVTKVADGSIEIRTSAAGKGKISILKDSWDGATAVSFDFTVKSSKKDLLDVDLGGLKTVVVNSNAKDQVFRFDVTLNGAVPAEGAVKIVDKKNTGLATISEDGKLLIAYKDGVKNGTYTITLQADEAKTNVKIRVSGKALDKAVTAKVKTKYDVVTGQSMLVVTKLKDVSGTIEAVSVAEEGFAARLDGSGNIVIDYNGDKINAENLKIGKLTLKLTISGLTDPVTLTLKNVKAKKTTPKVKVATITIPADAEAAEGKILGSTNIVSSYKTGSGEVKTLKPVKAEIVGTPKNVVAKVNESDPGEIDIYSIAKKSVSFKVKLTYAGGVTKTVTVKAKKK